MSLCNYQGNKKSKNYKTGVRQAQQHCADVQGLKGASVSKICTWYADPANCGNRA